MDDFCFGLFAILHIELCTMLLESAHFACLHITLCTTVCIAESLNEILRMLMSFITWLGATVHPIDHVGTNACSQSRCSQQSRGRKALRAQSSERISCGADTHICSILCPFNAAICPSFEWYSFKFQSGEKCFRPLAKWICRMHQWPRV